MRQKQAILCWRGWSWRCLQLRTKAGIWSSKGRSALRFLLAALQLNSWESPVIRRDEFKAQFSPRLSEVAPAQTSAHGRQGVQLRQVHTAGAGEVHTAAEALLDGGSTHSAVLGCYFLKVFH